MPKRDMPKGVPFLGYTCNHHSRMRLLQNFTKGWSTIFSLLANVQRVLFLLIPSPITKRTLKMLIFTQFLSCERLCLPPARYPNHIYLENIQQQFIKHYYMLHTHSVMLSIFLGLPFSNLWFFSV